MEALRRSGAVGYILGQGNFVILILDFGSQYTQLIARCVREARVYCEIHPYNLAPEKIRALNPHGIILSGGPASLYDSGAPVPPADIPNAGVPGQKRGAQSGKQNFFDTLFGG